MLDVDEQPRNISITIRTATMTTVGLVGGLGPESTIDYYRRILQRWSAVRPGSAPSIVVDSLDVQEGLRLVASSHAALAEYLVASLLRLTNAGVDFIAITANTPHIVFDALVPRSAVPLLSIVDCCADAAERIGTRRPLLLGTRFTMQADFYQKRFERRGMTVVTPPPEAQLWVHERYVDELLRGDFRDATRAGFVELVVRIVESSGVDSVILAGTELPLLLAAQEIAGVPVLDTTAIHVEAIVERLQRGGLPASIPAYKSSGITVQRLTAEKAHALAPSLASVLVDCVNGGASVGFMAPLSPDRATRFWEQVADGVARNDRALLAAFDEHGEVCGTVQVVYAGPENQPHRADISKMLVHRRARRRGVAQQLMAAADEAARTDGKTVLVLDTVTGSDAERLYQRAGWTRVGSVPKYALMPDGQFCSTTFFCKML